MQYEYLKIVVFIIICVKDDGFTGDEADFLVDDMEAAINQNRIRSILSQVNIFEAIKHQFCTLHGMLYI